MVYRGQLSVGMDWRYPCSPETVETMDSNDQNFRATTTHSEFKPWSELGVIQTVADDSEQPR